MGLEVPTERLSALANPGPDHLDCELIHKGVATRAIWNLAASTPRWSVAHHLDVVAPYHFATPPPLLDCWKPSITRETPDWSL